MLQHRDPAMFHRNVPAPKIPGAGSGLQAAGGLGSRQ